MAFKRHRRPAHLLMMPEYLLPLDKAAVQNINLCHGTVGVALVGQRRPAVQQKYLGGPAVRVDDPISLNTVPVVQIQLYQPVVLVGIGEQKLHRQI